MSYSCVCFCSTEQLHCFSDCASDSQGSWDVHHFTTYTGTPQEIPTDHGALLKTQRGYRVVIADGLGHWDPSAIGQVAAEVLNGVKETSLQQLISSVRTLTKQTLPEEEAYCTFLKNLAKKWKSHEGTTLLQLEACRLSPEKVELEIGKCGDSDVIALDENGKILWATVDDKHHLTPQGKGIGLLAIGGNFQEEWLNHATYLKVYVKASPAFIIACSDGLTEPYRLKDGTVDSQRFQYALRTGKTYSENTPLPPFTVPTLTPLLIGKHLIQAAHTFAKSQQEKNRWEVCQELTQKNLEPQTIESQLQKIHAGDDTTIVILKI